MAASARDELAAAIARIEASGTEAFPAPRRRSRSAGSGVDDAPAAAASPEGGGEAPLPERDIDGDRGPALVSLEGQAAHDAALGVPATHERSVGAQRPTRAKPAQLAFSDAEPHQRAVELAYKLVSQRERTVRQVREKLAAKDCRPEAIDAAVTELTRYGFLDDARYAKLYAEDKRRLQGWGSRRIRSELLRAGVARELLDGLFADEEAALDAPSELDAALELLRRKRPDVTDPKAKQRAAAMLARRGIASPVVFQALRAYAAEA